MKRVFLFFIACTILSACSSNRISTSEVDLVGNQSYINDASRYKQNIAIKQQGETFITYEYKDVRIDELASLAIKYCENKASGKQAYLREIILFKNNARRATFDCINLAM